MANFDFHAHAILAGHGRAEPHLVSLLAHLAQRFADLDDPGATLEIPDQELREDVPRIACNPYPAIDTLKSLNLLHSRRVNSADGLRYVVQLSDTALRQLEIADVVTRVEPRRPDRKGRAFSAEDFEKPAAPSTSDKPTSDGGVEL